MRRVSQVEVGLFVCRNSKFRPGLSKLKEDLLRVNMYAREANDLAQELSQSIRFHVTMQIPASNLSPNRVSVTLHGFRRTELYARAFRLAVCSRAKIKGDLRNSDKTSLG